MTQPEERLVGYMMLAPECMNIVAEVASADDFDDEVCKTLFECMAFLHEDGQPIDFISIGERLADIGKFELVGGTQRLVALAAAVQEGEDPVTLALEVGIDADDR